MRPITIIALLALSVALPAGAAVLYFGHADETNTVIASKPCFIAGNAGYLLTANGAAGHTVRVDNNAAMPDLRMQMVDDPAAADFVLLDDSDATTSCKGVSMVEHIKLDDAAEKPDLIVAMSRDPAAYKIYLHSTTYTEQEAAALAAVIWQRASKSRPLRTVSR